MTGTLGHVAAAALIFVGTHFALAMRPLRPWLVQRLGENGFRGFYSAVAILALVWLAAAYRHAPYVELWTLAWPGQWLVLLVMPVAVFLLVAGLTMPNPTAADGERAFDQTQPARGILTVTRHPVLWGIALWALAHIFVNGDVAALLLFGAMAALALGGMAHLDAKKRDSLGSAWGPFAMTTSVLPFQAIRQGRVRFDPAGIGWGRVALALAVYVALLMAHHWISGVPLIAW